MATPRHPPTTLHEPRRQLIAALQSCATAAEHCAATAVGLEAARDCIEASRDAATLCRTAAEMLSRSSTFEGWILPTALMACEVCALECDYHLDAFIQECARACHAVREAADRVSETEDTARTAADGRFNQVQASP